MADEEKPEKPFAKVIGPFHMISTGGRNPKTCPQCASGPDKWEVRNYSMIWRDGDIHCTVCGHFIRSYDAG